MADTLKEDLEPLMNPTELAGTADAAIAAEFAARDALEARDAAAGEARDAAAGEARDAAESEAVETAPSDELPLDGE